MALSEDLEASFIGNYGVKSCVYMIMSTRSCKAIIFKKEKLIIANSVTYFSELTTDSVNKYIAVHPVCSTHEPNYYSPAYTK